MRYPALLVSTTLTLLMAGCASQPASNPGLQDGLDAIGSGDFHRHIRELASDAFEGRAPFSEGERLTLEYLENAFAAVGMQPGYQGSFRQPVKLVSITATPAPMHFKVGDTHMQMAFGDDIVQGTTRNADAIAVTDSEVVFVGYGVVAPEYNWDDYAGLDVTDKTVIILVNDPGYATQDDALFSGNAMTYYGRWTYKYEEAARQGAAAAIIIHETAPASYPWAVVENGWSGEQFHLETPDRNMSRAAIEGWITRDRAQALFTAAGMDLDQLEDRAEQPGFTPVATGITMSSSFDNALKYSTSYNIVAKYPGKTDEAILYTAHWDHLGKNDDLIAQGEDGIYNGAVDNATGTAALLELAEAWSAQSVVPNRSIYFIAVTAEESGLLGSRQYVMTPSVPMSQTVAGINMDALGVYGTTSDVAVVGYGSSELEPILTQAANRQGRTVVPEPHPERGYYYRSDHFNFAKEGVPFLYAKSGDQYEGPNAAAALANQNSYTAERYHKPGDEYDPNWNLDGLVEDARLFFRIGYQLAYSDRWPNWVEGNEFRAIRDRSRAGE